MHSAPVITRALRYDATTKHNMRNYKLSSLLLSSWIHTRTQAFFLNRFVACAFPGFFFFFFFFFFFEVKSVLPIDRYQNATPSAISLHELKKVQLQERFTLVTQDSIAHQKTLCMSILSLAMVFQSESIKKNASVRVWIQLHAQVLIWMLSCYTNT